VKTGRAVGIDDGYFERGRTRRAPLIATLMKGPIVEGFRLGWIEIDGKDTTESIRSILLPLKDQLGVVFLYGTIFGGVNIVSLEELYENLKLPIIAVADDKPEEEKVRASIIRHGGSLEIYDSNPPMKALRTKRGVVYASFVGLTKGEAQRAIEAYQFSSRIPEPLRISHLMGREVGRWLLRSSDI
jgi:endonuclease V-like protein UPF0215 family